MILVGGGASGGARGSGARSLSGGGKKRPGCGEPTGVVVVIEVGEDGTLVKDLSDLATCSTENGATFDTAVAGEASALESSD